MKKMIYSTLIFVIFIGCAVTGFRIDDDFILKLGSENNKVASVLYFDVFHENLKTLKYDYYISYLKQNESISAKGLSKKIQMADSHYFKTKENSFLILLFYKKDRIIIGDNSATFATDTVSRLSANNENPDFEGLAKKMHF